MCQAHDLDQADRALQIGGDVPLAQGSEAGGHGYGPRRPQPYSVGEVVARGSVGIAGSTKQTRIRTNSSTGNQANAGGIGSQIRLASDAASVRHSAAMRLTSVGADSIAAAAPTTSPALTAIHVQPRPNTAATGTRYRTAWAITNPMRNRRAAEPER